MKTDRKRIPEKLKKLKKWLVDNRGLSVDKIMKRVNQSLLGHFNYYGVPTNVRQLMVFKNKVEDLLFKVLNKRSQRKSYTWIEFKNKVLERFTLARPKIYVYI